MRCLYWVREHDLRINDNTALYHASEMATQGVIAAFIISAKEWQKHNMAACRVDFILRNLKLLSSELAQLNIPLLIIHESTYSNIPQILLTLSKRHQIDGLFFNEQYELDEKRRDDATVKLFQEKGLTVMSYTDQVILAPGEVLTQSNHYYTVFTPFKNAWLQKVKSRRKISLLPKPQMQSSITLNSDIIPNSITGYSSSIPTTLWPAGEKVAQDRLAIFINTRINDYHINRDYPAIDGTSSLSPYLTSGIISPRQCLNAILQINQQKLDSGKQGAVIWLSELIWREFYKHILISFPRVCMNKPFKLITEKIAWDNNKVLFSRWQNGQTGFPIIDAAMRQLLNLGWMHNRLRMIVAMFLSKNLLIDWRWGEKHFMQHLIDGDLAANNGGWQWAASTGTDAVPYFRIFNPITQSKKFDPEGQFIKHYCPELKGLNADVIHEPWKCGETELKKLNYPKPIIDLTDSRQRAISAFKSSN